MTTYKLKIPTMSNSKVNDLIGRHHANQANFMEEHIVIAMSRHLNIPPSEVTVSNVFNITKDLLIEHHPSKDIKYVKVDGELILTFRQNGLTLEAIHED